MSKRALLVEDELLVAFDLQDIIEGVGLLVDGPHVDIAGANIALNHAMPDIAILDVSLRDGDVFPIADRLNEHGIAIIFHSGHADQADLSSRYPAAAICSKPCSPVLFAQTIERLIEGR